MDEIEVTADGAGQQARCLYGGEALARALTTLDPIGLDEMDAVALMERRDTKYLFHRQTLIGALAALAPHYRVLEVEGRRAQAYGTVYFDTSGFDLFAAHHRDQPSRYKVRRREYVESGLAFLEVKRRSRGRTSKERIATDAPTGCLDSEGLTFLESRISLSPGLLEAKVATEFSRITLVSRDRAERLTLDYDLRFRAACGERRLSDVVIAEVKEGVHAGESPVKAFRRAANLHPVAISKYCTGASLLYPSIKHNRFNPQLRRVIGFESSTP